MRRMMLGLAAVAAVLTTSALLVPEGEVVTLHTRDAAGGEFETQLWIARVAGDDYLRASSPDNHWLERLRARPRVELSRSRHALPEAERERFEAVVADAPDVRAAVNEAFARKYGLADRLWSLVADRSSAVAVRLVPAEGAAGEDAP
ncbi:MAG: hypothetical protein KC560_19130 [Myxococcales bacterium]|nr:hypothetical protein [Myxococcales bacterium]